MRRLLPMCAMAAIIVLSCARGEECDGGGVCVEKNPNRVPDVVGLPLRQAERRLVDAGYACQARPDSHDETEAGIVIAQDPAPGERGFEAEVIRITVSMPPGKTVPLAC